MLARYRHSIPTISANVFRARRFASRAALTSAPKVSKPVYPGDVITAHCEVADIQYKEKAGFYVVKIKQWVKNQNGDIVTEGVATVMPPKVSVEIPK